MVGPVLSYKDVKNNAKSLPGIKIIKGKVFYKTLYENWRQMDEKDFIWHRGKGRWSKIDDRIDMKRRAHSIPLKYWKRHRQTGDLSHKRI